MRREDWPWWLAAGLAIVVLIVAIVVMSDLNRSGPLEPRPVPTTSAL